MSQSDEPEATLILFARYPAPGACKTRLIPQLGAVRAAEFARAFLLDLLARLDRELPERIAGMIAFDPPDSQRRFEALLQEFPFESRFSLWPQPSGHLGARLAGALAGVPKAPTIFIGSDAPEIPVQEIMTAAQVTGRGGAYLVPAADGGYALLGLPTGAPVGVFDEIRWSTAETCADQLRQLRRAGLETQVSDATCHDIDEIRDLENLWQRTRAQPETYPETWALLNLNFAGTRALA